MSTETRLDTKVFVAVLFCQCFIFLAACNPGTRLILGDEAPPAPDMAGAPPPSGCETGLVRCSANQQATEICDGNNWVTQTVCQSGDSCIDGACKGPCDLLTQGNVGCSFYPVNLWSTSTTGQFGIVVSNTSDTLTANLTLEDASGNPVPLEDASGNVLPPQPLSVPPASGSGMGMGGLAILRLDHTFNKLSQTEQAKKGLHLVSTAPVAVYQFHPIDAATVWSGSATLLLPEQVMAKNYFIMSYTYNAELMTTPPQGQGLLAVVGLSDNTQVQVTVPVATMSGPGVTALPAGGTLTRTLNRLEVLEVIQANSLEDISGAIVTASAPVAVYGGAGGVSIPSSAVGGNHLGVQMFPLETWGKSYLAAKVKQRNASDKDYFRIVASVDNTQVTLSGGSGLPANIPLLMKGKFYEFSTASDFLITANQPIMAFQYMPAWGNLSGTYDPAQFPQGVSPTCPYANTSDDVKCLGDANMTPLIPVKQYRNDYIFYVPETYEYQYVNVLAPLGTNLTMDGNPVTSPLSSIDGTFGKVIVNIAQPGNHRISGDQPFGIIGYGYAWATSYSYAGGLNLARINPVE